VLVVTRFKSEEEALRLANDSDYGLGARSGPAISPAPTA
jgi:acyl-CoA reductase-like NAD-dependent aldehyde dehydrogenase